MVVIKLLLTIAIPFLAAIDLAVLLPPGTPVDNLAYKFAIRSVKTRTTGSLEPEAKKPKGTGVVRKSVEPPEAPPPSGFSVDSSVPIPTKDAAGEMGIAEANYIVDKLIDSMTTEMVDPRVTVVEGVEKEEQEGENEVLNFDPIVYEPYDTKRSRLEVFLLTFGRSMLRIFHANSIVETEDLILYTLLGAPAATAKFQYGEPILERFAKKANEYINPENEPPKLMKMGSPYETMVNSLVMLELLRFYPFSNAPYAPNLNNFPRSEVYTHVKQLLNSSNKRVRRNATYYLGMIEKYDDLFDLLKGSADNVIKARALFFLTQVRYPGIVDYLLKRLPEEEDKVFRYMIVYSLGRLGDPAAFPLLMERLKAGDRGDFDMTFALVRSLTRCVDIEDKEQAGEFKEVARKLYNEVDKRNPFHNVQNPDDRKHKLDDPPSYSRGKIMKGMLEVALAVTGHKVIAAQIEKKLTDIYQRFTRAKSLPLYGGPMQQGFEMPALFHILDVMPRFNRGKVDYANGFLKKMLSSGNEHPDLIAAGIESYLAINAENFESIVRELIINEADIRLIDKALKYMYATGQDPKIVEPLLKNIISDYDPEGDPVNIYKKHLMTLAVYYLGLDDSIPDKVLIKIISGELRQPERMIALDKLYGNMNLESITMHVLLTFRVDPNEHLYRLAIEALGRTGTKAAMKYLVKLSQDNYFRVRRVAAKALGSFKEPESAKALTSLLLDKDGWTRVIAYLSLKRMTGVERDTDWYFTPVSDLAVHAQDFSEHIGKALEE